MCGTRNEIAKVVLSHTLRMPNEGSSFLGERCSTSFGGCKIRPKTGASETLPTADDYVPTLFCFFKVMEAFKKKELGHAWISSIQIRTTAAIVIYGPRKLRLPSRLCQSILGTPFRFIGMQASFPSIKGAYHHLSLLLLLFLLPIYFESLD